VGVFGSCNVVFIGENMEKKMKKVVVFSLDFETKEG